MARTPSPALALAILAVAGPDVGGLWLRARAGGTRSAFQTHIERLFPNAVRISPTDDDLVLFGGVDVAASLTAGRRIVSEGLLEREGPWTLNGAERASAGLGARLSTALDAGRGPLIAIDEGAEPEEVPPHGLTTRLGLFVELEGLRAKEAGKLPGQRRLKTARRAYADVSFSGELETVLVELSGAFGVFDPRHVSFARAAARALAALDGRKAANTNDLEIACRYVIAPRGIVPEVAQQEIQPEADRKEADGAENSGDASGVDDSVAEAATLALEDLLLPVVGKAPRRTTGAGAGGREVGWMRGRPMPSTKGRYSAGRRMDPVATIRNALPFQRLRAPAPGGQKLALRPSDIALKRYQKHAGRVIIFAVDASGSQAMARMAEAKGAVECLLAEAYRSRDEVALIAFRGKAAELLLPPTRALVRARSALRALPAGGGTPLAAGLLAAKALADQVKAQGQTPVLVLLSDGRANVALSGAGDRTLAKSDAVEAASALRATPVESLVLDTGRRPEPGLQDLANRLSGRYLAVPNGTARSMSAAVSNALEA